MATLTVIFDTPLPNAGVGDVVSANGSLLLDANVKRGTSIEFGPVTVEFGENGEVKTATGGLGAWQSTGRVSGSAIGGQPLTISGFASARYRRADLPDGEDEDVVFGSGAVVVILAQSPPELTVDNFPTEVTPPSLPYRLQLHGAAIDPGSGISVVQYRVGNGAFANVDNLNGNWSSWGKAVDLFPGEYSLEIQAKDTHQTSTSKHFTISIRTPFQPPSPELAFATTTYLQELMGFAERRLRVGTRGTGPSAIELTARFAQPFDRLTKAEIFQRVTRPVHQARIAVEVLRLIKGLTAPQSFFFDVYKSLLLELGTSIEELRAARIANAATRRALAERLGIGTLGASLGRLDQITLESNQVTEAQLEQIFGFAGVNSNDPLRPELPAGQVLNWRLSATQDRWLLEDIQARDGAKGPLPIIDPDLVARENLLATTAGDRVFDLWNARKIWIDQKLAAIEAQRSQGFEQVIHTFIGNIDLAGLAAQDATGEDISPALDAVNLDLDAFRFLARCRELATTIGLSTDEIADIDSIVLQVQKKRQYQQWRGEEFGISLSPQYFQLPDNGAGSISNPTTIPWRVSARAYTTWRKTLATRIIQLQEVKDSYQSALDATEAKVMPALRDGWLQGLEAENPSNTVDRLSRQLSIDLRASGAQMTTRASQAIETLQAAIFSVRAGRLSTGSPSTDWSIDNESTFDQEWTWMSSYQTWRAAMTVFAYPESQLYPNLFVTEEPFLKPTKAFTDLIVDLQKVSRLTPALAIQQAAKYLSDLRRQLGASLRPKLQDPPPTGQPIFVITEQVDLKERKKLVTDLFTEENVTQPHKEPGYLFEIFWLVPMALGFQLQKAGHFLTALDWYQTVYAFNLSPQNRKIYRGLELEESITSSYDRVPEWLLQELNPHIFAQHRNNAYTRFTVMSIVRCCLEFADAEFSRGDAEAVARARTLYETAQDLLNLLDVKPETGPSVPFTPNPIWESLRLHADTNLMKIHRGLNIAGLPIAPLPANGSAIVVRPSQYRYATLAERAKQLVGLAEQVESAYLAALERLDAESYSLLQAGHDLKVAQATVSLQNIKISDANLSLQIAQLQQDKAQTQFDFYDRQIQDGLSGWEIASLAAMGVAAELQTAAGALFFISGGMDLAKESISLGIVGDALGKFGQALSAFSGAASLVGGIAQAKASFERREQEWRQQKSLSEKDVAISGAQISLAQNQQLTAKQERDLAQFQSEHAQAMVDFLANKFTNAELFEWMSGVLGRVYNYFLQQATAVALLAQSQLAFERQEPALSVIQSDYWQITSDGAGAGATNGSAPDRRGLTGSARLLQDIFQLDQYAFETKQRKLQLTQTLSLAQIAPMEMQALRETGKMIFATPMEIFDRGFPGHYLRQMRRARISVIALIPPTQGVRATLAASGISRVVTGGDTFETVQVQRAPETIAFTSPNNATGLFELETDGDLLLPFEGMGVDTSWELQIPKAANPFDYRAIADVLLTIEYTALFSSIYQRRVIKQLNGGASGERMFSLRNQFADAWYDLNNPETVEVVEHRMVADFSTVRDDFPPHIEDLSIGQVTLLVARRDGFTEEISIDGLTFTPEGETAPIGGAAQTVSGIVGTRRPNGSPWIGMLGKSPVGAWKLQLPNTDHVINLFKQEKVEDIALVVTFDGGAPAWPV
jgi:hypothetical protein